MPLVLLLSEGQQGAAAHGHEFDAAVAVAVGAPADSFEILGASLRQLRCASRILSGHATLPSSCRLVSGLICSPRATLR